MELTAPAPCALRQYSLLADGERGALVGPHGDVARLCAPRWDSGSVFGSLLGAAGDYIVSPAERHVWGGSYEDATLIWRHRVDARPLGAAEGAFLLCSFVAALACHQVGDDLTARHFFERARSACGPPGLFTEEFDVAERQLRGNLPQGFVHALLLECSATLTPLEG